MTPLIRIGLYALLVILIFGAGYYKGYAPEHEAHLKDNATAASFKASAAYGIEILDPKFAVLSIGDGVTA